MPLLLFFQGNLNASSKCQGNLSNGWRDNSITAENVNVVVELEEKSGYNQSCPKSVRAHILKVYCIFIPKKMDVN